MQPITHWGRKKIPLTFDIQPYPVAEAPPDLPPKLVGYEPEVINVLERFAEPGDCCVDAGASIGFHTCMLSKLVGEDGLVLAFEPHLESFKHLMHHVHVTNKLNNVGCCRAALWKEDCSNMQLWSPEQLGYASFHRAEGTACSDIVDGLALDGVLSEAGHPRVIKIDCEGTEAEVLLGAQSALKRGVDCVVLELNYYILGHTGRSDHTIREYMASLGYDMFLINISDGNGDLCAPIKVDPDREIKLEGAHHHINVLFSTEAKVAQRW
jgi:FkbM family methyltransferase